MSEAPDNLKYAESHEWVQVDDGVATIGISDHAQDALGDLVFVEVPEVGATFDAGDAAAVVESVKAASDVYSPVSGEVIAVNEALADAPELINDEPYGEGWIMRIRMTDDDELDNLMDAEAYAARVTDDD
ncbi:glycine cleavage system protein GcvH [bacterium]|nr:glycine cleavage system protein GcvH [bacterium]